MCWTALGTQDQFQLVALFRQFILLGAQLELFELGQVAQFELEDRLGLVLADVDAPSSPGPAPLRCG